MRITTVLNRVLDLKGASVAGVELTDGGLIVEVRPRRRVYRCPCGRRSRSRYDQIERRWRHLDLSGQRVWLRARVARIWCRRCQKVVTEDVAWARPGSRQSRDFEDMVAWLVQRMDKTSVARLMRSSWETINGIVGRVVDEFLDAGRLDGLYRIGVDEISYRRGHKYLTVVTDHDSKNVVWVGEGRSRATLEQFYAELGQQRCDQLEVVTMDAAQAYIGATESAAPNAAVCIDPFHVIAWANDAVDRALGNSQIALLRNKLRSDTGTTAWRKTRTVLRHGQEKLRPEQRQVLRVLRRERRQLFRAWVLKEELRDLFRDIQPTKAAAYLERWIRRTVQSNIPAMHALASKVSRVFDGIVAGRLHQVSNGRSEGHNTKIRVIQRRGYGHHGPRSLMTMIYLCNGGIKIKLPTER